MDSARSQILWFLPLLGAIGVLLNSYRKKRAHGLPYPPGPGFLHAVKGLATVDSSAPWLLFVEWRKRYGPLVYLDVAQPMLIIHSEIIARELLEKRASKYSSRPESPTFELYGWGFTTALLPYNDKWRQHRRFYQRGFRPDVAIQWRPFQLQKARTLLLNLLNSPEDHVEHFATFTASTIMAITYGYTTAPHDDPLLNIVNRAIAIFVKSTAILNVIIFSTFTFLESLPTWLPGLGFYREASVSRGLSRKMLDAPFDFVKKSMGDGTAQVSLVSEFLAQNDEGTGPLASEETIKEVAASGLSAGIETTSSHVMVFLMAIAMHPSVQEQAQAEIDSVIGTGRLPDFDDRPSLPYIEAVLRETLRWQQASPFGAPHTTTEDDVYDGVFIPKSMLTTPLSWSTYGTAIAHDESKYPDPHTFNPSRFLTPEGKLNDDDMHVDFGFGRRICPGRHVAEASLWAAIVSILAAFNVRKAKDEKGNDIEITPAMTPGQVVRPVPFPCRIIPRSAEKENLVRMDD
ncbi:hypothetical protein HYDPIDRAFT_31894 [Hydnomerulius pinastri MD-312]|uniref:Cytochrome P450 n=1 Tax=Hydnomerulius pinastri MD-312 TaxID=994086 RepID=A0A0C9WB15_9AGAM|nr:hypothetical protein HYDPIDRAFT_31894 [Hydnomerulius pinastri MD-312]